MKMRSQLKKGLIVLAGIAMLSTSLLAKEIVTYPKDNKATQALGFEKLENSFGISSSAKGNTVYINSGGKPLERVFGAVEDNNNKFPEIKNNKVIINGGVLATNGFWERDGVKTVRGGSVYGGAGQNSVVSDNEIIIKGNSKIGGNVYGGYSHRGSVINNKIVIEGNSVLFGKESILFGGRGSRNINVKDNKPAPIDVITGNTLDLKAKNVKVKDVKNFEKIVFEISNANRQNDKILILTNSEGAAPEKPEVVKISSKITDISETEKEKILAEKNKAINLDINVIFQNKPSKNIRNLKIALINAENGLELSKLPENIEKTEKGYKYSVKFEKDAKNLYAVINATLVKN